MKTKNKNSIIIIGSLFLGIFLGWIFFAGGDKVEVHEHTNSEQMEESIWTCSMHPQIRENEPGDCPLCGMELIPVQNETAKVDPEAVHMSEYALKLANVQTITVGGQEAASNEIRLNGKIAVNEQNVAIQSAHLPGRIEQLFVNFPGEEVNRGQALARIYSPEMVTAQEELLQAYKIRESNPRLFEAAKEKLRNWRIGESQINHILETQQASEEFTITSDVNGIVTKKMVELGDYVARGTPIYEIADLSQLWVLFDIYENNMNWIEEGSTMEFSVASIPGETFEGEIEFIDPILDNQTRVANARVIINNKSGRLKPGMFVTGSIEKTGNETDSKKITVPKSAVLWTGKRSVVYVKQSTGNFELREVVLGSALGNGYSIAEGLQAGEEIVVNGAFTVDAAAQLAGKPSMMNPETNKIDDAGSVQLEISEEIKSELNLIVAGYLDMKDALVADNFSAAKENALELEETIKNMNASLLNQEAMVVWESYSEELESGTGNFLTAKNIDEIRNIFIDFSETMIGLTKTFQPINEALYVLHCPMANKDDGADWLSLSPEIRNPYYGSAMLSCGEIKKKLN